MSFSSNKGMAIMVVAGIALAGMTWYLVAKPKDDNDKPPKSPRYHRALLDLFRIYICSKMPAHSILTIGPPPLL